MNSEPILTNQACTTARIWHLSDVVQILRQNSLLDETIYHDFETEIENSNFKQTLIEDISLICIDSRAAGPNSLFVALKGERSDGHDYLAAVAAAGTRFALVDAGNVFVCSGQMAKLAQDYGLIGLPVTDPLAGLQALAKSWLVSLPSVVKIGVTGSSGKTTTKDLLQSAIGLGKRVFASKGNLNSVIGLPLAALALGPDYEVAIFEMAMSEAKEMAVLADIVLPDLVVITNIGLAHIGNIGSQQGIAYEKKQIFSRFDGRQTAFIPQDDEFSGFLAKDIKGQVVYYGEKNLANYEGHDRWVSGQILRWDGHIIHVRLPGAHNRSDAIAAISVAVHLGVSPELICQGLESFVPGFGRSEIVHGGVTLVQDCYNANPDSMKASIEAFVEMDTAGGSRVMILGDMLELGNISKSRHADIGRIAARSGADVVLFCGTEMQAAYDAASEIEASDGALFERILHLAWFETRDQLALAITDYVDSGDLVLLKASRGMEMEKLAPALLALESMPSDEAIIQTEELDPELLSKYLVTDDDEESSDQ